MGRKTLQLHGLYLIIEHMITIRKANQTDALTIIDFQLKMAWETEELALSMETKNTRAQMTYRALGMSSEHYSFYEWMRK
jgi:hypothetical protein